MIIDILKIILFMLLINWSISMQILNQNTNIKRVKIIAICLSMIFVASAGVLFV